MNQEEREKWVAAFRQRGYSNPIQIGAGMEGVVYLLKPGELVAKVWGDSDLKQLNALAAFYKELAVYVKDIRTPEIMQIEHIGNRLVSFEKFLGGATLQDRVKQRPNDKAVLAVLKVLGFLKSIPYSNEFNQLGVVGNENNPWHDSGDWAAAITLLFNRRCTLYQHLLEHDIENFSNLKEQARLFLKSRSGVKTGLIHGDFFGENILVDGDSNPTAVLDFGFLSMAGDPAFDAAITSSIFDMYGPHAAEIDAELTQTFAEYFGYKIETLLAYKAVYAIISSNAFSQDRNDGHYQWCINILKRDNVLSALGM
ncbi:MAG: aminoglycoside phosphotransferase family protein [Anaerolineae bacterium]